MTNQRKTKMTNWTNIFNVLGTDAIENFASGELSARSLYNQAKGTEVAGDVRTLVRSGAARAVTLARKALSRR